MSTTVVIPQADTQAAIAQAAQTRDHDKWLQTIVNQITECSRVGILSFNTQAEYVTADIKSELEDQDYVVGAPSNGKVLISWSA